jgi:predicted enzyme related to lactoylglutathione lyase
VVEPYGRFTWYELVTTDVAAAKAFYTSVMGWGAWDASAPGMPYFVFTAGEAAVGGLMSLPQDARDAGVTASWIGHVGVDDVDVSAERTRRLGGTVHVPPTNVGNISRFAIISDPQSVRLGLFQWQQRGGRPPSDPTAPGRVGWHELLAADWEEALAFYAGLFGWEKADADIDSMGTYQLFSAAGETIGGMVAKPDTIPTPYWLYYFNVSDIDAAAERVEACGGQILSANEVPGGSWIARCEDPQGALFALEGNRGRKPIGYFVRAEPGMPSTGRGPKWSW